jgi:hypothetical protein
MRYDNSQPTTSGGVNWQFTACSSTTSNPIVGDMVQLSPPTLTQLDWASTGEVKVKRALRLAIAVKFLNIGRSFSYAD